MLKRATLTLVCLVTVSSASAQTDLVGDWMHPGGTFNGFHEEWDERFPGPELGDYLGLPLNEAGRWRAESWDASLWTVPEHQCMPHPTTYALRGPLTGTLRFAVQAEPVTQRVVAYYVTGTFRRADRVIWMDGRPHPPDYAAHTWAGFSTGTWVGSMLKVETTHLKNGWLRRNGVTHSDLATMTEYFVRHGDRLTAISIVTDPIYLTEPLVKTSDFVLVTTAPGAGFGGGAGLGSDLFFKCFATSEIATRSKHAVPHYPPGANPFIDEFRKRYRIPLAAINAGAEAMYPEFMQKLK